MKVLLASLNRDRFVHRVAPIGPLHLAAALRERGHEVRFVDVMFADRPEQALAEAARAFSPELIGVAIRNLDTLLSKGEYRVPEVKRHVEALRACSAAPIVGGGPGFSLLPEELVSGLGLDFGIVGEADRSFPALVDALAARTEPEAIPGLVFRKGGVLVENPPDIVEDLDAIPFQAVDLVDAKQYARRRGNLAVFTRKACPHDCIYCPEAALHGQQVRLRSATRVVDEMEHIVRTTGVVDLDFADTTFNVPRTHALAVCEEIVRRKLKIRFEVELSPVGQDLESVRLLRRAGCVGVDLTADSGSDRMLRVLNKGYAADVVHQVTSLYHREHIPYTVGFLLGGPGEDEESIRETLRLTASLPGSASVYFTVGIRVFRNTALARIAAKETAARAATGQSDLPFYLSERFDARCAQLLIDACRENLGWYVSDMFFTPTMKRFLAVADALNVRPLWKHGGMPKLYLKLVHLGRDTLTWDARTREFRA